MRYTKNGAGTDALAFVPVFVARKHFLFYNTRSSHFARKECERRRFTYPKHKNECFCGKTQFCKYFAVRQKIYFVWFIIQGASALLAKSKNNVILHFRKCKSVSFAKRLLCVANNSCAKVGVGVINDS